ncbi:hypothetical protein M885DRAFT_531346 [Pelagophyceae sp. CCMP2097]|nr:hypothetical protein M885DRAFT_531346 [Pelagophyceae sp. CCMP2097]
MGKQTKRKVAKEDAFKASGERAVAGPVKTTSASLQTKLDELAALAAADDKVGFVKAFVPLDLSKADAGGFLDDLTNGPEAAGQWANLAAEIIAIAEGRKVARIEGDQSSEACFFFEHPLLPKCDREVVFDFKAGEWRAQA